MAAAAACLPAIIGVVGKLLDNKKSARTTTAQSQTSQTSKGTSTTEGVLTGRQGRLLKTDIDALLNLINAGPTVLQGDRNAMRGSINQTYNAMRPRLESALAGRGFGQSGKLGTGFKGIELERGKAFQTAEQDLQHEAMQRFLQTIGLSRSFLNPYTTTTTQSGEQMGTSTGSNTAPSQFGNILGGLGGNLATALWLSKLFGGGGGGDGYGAESGGGGYEW